MEMPDIMSSFGAFGNISSYDSSYFFTQIDLYERLMWRIRAMLADLDGKEITDNNVTVS